MVDAVLTMLAAQVASPLFLAAARPGTSLARPSGPDTKAARQAASHPVEPWLKKG